MKVYGQLEKAQLENKTSDLAGTLTGAAWVRSDEKQAKFSDGSIVRTVLAVGGTASDSAKFHRETSRLLQLVNMDDTTADGTRATVIAQLAARLPNYTDAGKPAASVDNRGMIIWNTTLVSAYISDGSNWLDMLGGGGGGAAGIALLQEKIAQEKITKVLGAKIDNSIHSSAVNPPQSYNYTAYLMSDYVSPSTILDVVFNPIFLNDSDKNTDSTTNWTAIYNATNLTATASDKKIGANSLSFDKSNTLVNAEISYDRGSLNLGLNSNPLCSFWIKLPSISNLNKVYLSVKVDGANYDYFDVTTDVDGNALAVGWNKILVDVRSTSSGTAGTGWDISKLARYVGIGVEASSASQTYTGILVDSVCFSMPSTELGLKGSELTIHDNSNRESFILDGANTRQQVNVTIAALTNSYAGGGSGASASMVKRVDTLVAGDQFIMARDGFSGDFVESQSVRLSRLFRETVSGNFDISVDTQTPQTYKVVELTSGTVIKVEDPSNTTSNLKSGDKILVFKRDLVDGEESVEHLSEVTLSIDATHLSGVTTLTTAGTWGSVALDDYAIKNPLSAVSMSAVGAATTNESFTSATRKAIPNGIVAGNVATYPALGTLYGHWRLGDRTDTEARKNIVKNRTLGNNLTSYEANVGGSHNYEQGRRSGKLFHGMNSPLSLFSSAYGNYSSANPENYFFNLQVRRVNISFWMIPNSTGAGGALFTDFLTAGSNSEGWAMFSGVNNLRLFTMTWANNYWFDQTYSLVAGKWNHIFLSAKNGDFQLYINGVMVVSSGAIMYGPMAHSVAQPTIGASFHSNSGIPSLNVNDNYRMQDLIIWTDAIKPTAEQVQSIYGSGYGADIGVFPNLRHNYLINGLSGKKYSLKATLQTTTDAITPLIDSIGAIKS